MRGFFYLKKLLNKGRREVYPDGYREVSPPALKESFSKKMERLFCLKDFIKVDYLKRHSNTNRKVSKFILIAEGHAHKESFSRQNSTLKILY